MATGHYCQKEIVYIENKSIYRLISGVDGNKDQSYFLCQLTQNQLAKTLFPIGHLQKSEVRKIARELDLVTAEKRLSRSMLYWESEFARFFEAAIATQNRKHH